jgi:hypothetical protein
MIGSANRAISQPPASEKFSTVLRQILSLQFDHAEKLITEFGKDPVLGLGMIYLHNYLEFLDALISGDRYRYEKYLSAAQVRLDSIQSVYGHLPDRLAIISAIYLQSSFLNAFHGENFKAARNFYVAKRYFRQAESACPGNPFNEKLAGLLNIIAGSAPVEYHWLMKIFGIKGDLHLGFDQLLEYHSGASGSDKLESCLILMYAFQIAGQETEEQMDDCDKDTLTLHMYFHAYHALKSGHSREVIELLEAWQQEEGEMPLYYFDLLLGEALLNSADARAGDQFNRFLNRTRGEHYVKTAWHKLSWHYFLEGDSAGYRKARENAIEQGNLILDADKQAFREAGENIFPNAFLLRSRLYFDGGYYRRSSETLQHIKQGDLASIKDSIEYTYRRARIADKLGDTDEAISGYKEVVGAGKSTTWYFPSNAALHLGMIYEEKGDTAQALDSYETCLKMNRSAYRSSIGHKAQGGIKRLK